MITERLFTYGMYARIVYGGLRIILAGVLLGYVGVQFSDLLSTLMAHELIEDPNDALVHAIQPLLRHASFTVTFFLASYLLFWGVIDIFLSVQILRKRLWAFSASMCAIGLFTIYEIYRFSHSHSTALLIVTLFDVVILYLLHRERQKILRR